MFFYTRMRRFIAWLVAAAMLFASLSPSLANAVTAAGKNAPLGEICTASPASFAGLDAPSKPTKDHAGKGVHKFAHCAFCSTHSGAIGLPQQDMFRIPDLSQVGKPALFYQAPSPLHAWAPPQSHAPPAA